MFKKALKPLTCAMAMAACMAHAAPVSFTDAVGDDFGPGSYTYPTNPVYTAGSFDMTAFRVTEDGKNYKFEVDVAEDLADEWNTGAGFSVQMFFVFVDAGQGKNTEALPGLNVRFADDSAWEKVVIMSPQSARRVKAETRKARKLRSSIIIPESTQGSGRTITSIVPKSELSGNPSNWKVQVVVQSNEGFPDGKDMLTRQVNSSNGEHRFGGGDDSKKCDPHVIDILGDHSQLSYDCAADKQATLKLFSTK